MTCRAGSDQFGCYSGACAGTYNCAAGACSAGKICQAGACIIAAWWQVKDADLISQGDIRSTIPSSAYKLIDDGEGGYPGIAAYSGTISVGSGTLSSKDWMANITPSPYTGRKYDYEYFTGSVPPEVFTDPKYAIDATINVSQLKNENKQRPDGYFWNYRNGDLSTNSNLIEMSEKVILIVNGNLTIGNNITVENGVGFFGAIVKGNLTLDPQISHPNNPSLEGIFLTDGVFATGAGSGRLYLRGSVIAWGGVNLQRDLGGNNSTTAAEYFEYAPDLLMTFPRELLRKGKVWREIAP
ncbi:MAG: hypothetical protein A3A58_00540 [Candidatus Blackburnbacteria bacterium RIFCSPLOWO2_01_FULL_41_27]|uniref:Uncharacterized protein n=1 Tax=Candidatus Blackburnbacteria bacterium RIFCSPLOWO2_01_FULL_41_27 TaxID=1797520 RepID=A0A1G1VIE0_9BACT|nr:MAG: hypothetical protein A3A58_00540 [Candidatus Blackburnbacteria bacterium RIFCSPLOWO2_01_FULL_41_27]